MYSKALGKLGIITIEDLLNYVPTRYKDLRKVSKIKELVPGEIASITGTVDEIKNVYTRFGKKIQIAQISDNSGSIQATWFNQTFLVNNLKKGTTCAISGKVDSFNNKVSFVSPDYEILTSNQTPLHSGRIVPIYPETAGVSSKWLRTKIDLSYKLLKDELIEFLPNDILLKRSLINYQKAIHQTHFPEKPGDELDGRKRLAFNELLFHNLRSLLRKRGRLSTKMSHELKVDKMVVEEFIANLPFKLTRSQKIAIDEVLSDLKKELPMNRLLEGDVGSGKTVVAAAAAFTTFINGYQSVFMAPTQILAEQHYKTLQSIFAKYKIRISLVTSSGVKEDFGTTDIYVGTHALIHKKVKFDKVALVIIDEQHRFGVEQREHLITLASQKKRLKGKIVVPNVLTMTATPIPRTVALTLYGDLDLSVLSELPKGRQTITTWIVPTKKRPQAYEWINTQIIKDKVQAFVICPLIDESDVETLISVKAATKEFENLKQVFSKQKVDILHGRQKASLKQEVLESFRNGKTDILISTPVVEVGIDVPNASIMVIEAAERYGLAQLHQLRGRVGRGTKKSYCLIFTNSNSENVKTRLSALTKNLSGFELSELDLQMRGPGELLGTRQHGFPELKIASWSDTELIKESRELAETIIKRQNDFRQLITKVTSQTAQIEPK